MVMWDLVTDEQLLLPELPSETYPYWHGFNAVVLCGDHGCNHLDCHGGPFTVVFVRRLTQGGTFATVYSSETGAWNYLSLSMTFGLFGCVAGTPGVLAKSRRYKREEQKAVPSASSWVSLSLSLPSQIPNSSRSLETRASRPAAVGLLATSEPSAAGGSGCWRKRGTKGDCSCEHGRRQDPRLQRSRHGSSGVMAREEQRLKRARAAGQKGSVNDYEQEGRQRRGQARAVGHRQVDIE
ncbi:hypothetical protein PR202_gb12084 [Eleusine coracana subsp. coracana]|uniref:Uncharacterized protein n=1 Tax=Eleusine coracana subsp. coracana TaxID=191504 RepID=A0AAV5ENC3_ELECO|nr:hypothetical protein PR202_gb12084 [Eleusine coracana subsp. coracana]